MDKMEEKIISLETTINALGVQPTKYMEYQHYMNLSSATAAISAAEIVASNGFAMGGDYSSATEWWDHGMDCLELSYSNLDAAANLAIDIGLDLKSIGSGSFSSIRGKPHKSD